MFDIIMILLFDQSAVNFIVGCILLMLSINDFTYIYTYIHIYIHIYTLEKSSGQKQKPCNFLSGTNSLGDEVVIKEIVQHYSNHPSIFKIRENFDNSQTVEQFQFNSVTTSEIYKLLKI